MAKLSTCSLLLLLLVNVKAQEHPSLAVVNEWSRGIGSWLTTVLDNVTGIDYLTQKYKDANIKVVEVKADQIVAEIADNWEQLLGLKMAALKRLVQHIEAAAMNHTYDPDLTPDDVHYNAAKNLNLTVANSTQFGQAVNMTASVVHIPTDIYDGDPRILNGINWTSGLDEVFVENYKKDTDLIWQYFGSSEGFMRTYPAHIWSLGPNAIDQYDVRRRGWYIQAVASPKDMMILIDVSGSVHGLVLELIRSSAVSLIDTLGENDFVNVVSFNESALLISCFETFVQANERNKNILKEQIKQLTDNGIARFDVGFTFAFEEFLKFEKSEPYLTTNQGASCNKVIMVLTDGGGQKPAKIFQKYKPLLGDVRVFTYVVGPQVSTTDGVKYMACANKGYFTRIPAVGAIRLDTLNYVKVLSRPMALNRARNFQWSNIYLDAMGLGMMTTVTLPVYNRTTVTTDSNSTRLYGNDTNTWKNQQMLGVTGTDVTIADMEELIPHYKHALESDTKTLGPVSYAFGINSNGYILIHPRLKGQLGYLIEPPNVDFLEVELDAPGKDELRRDMIDEIKDTRVVETLHRNSNGEGQIERYVFKVNMTYAHQFIENTSFSMAIALPSFNLWVMNIKDTDFEDRRSENLMRPNNSLILFAPWQFCRGQDNNDTTEAVLQHLRSYFETEGAPVPEGCDEEMAKRTLFDLQVTSDLESEWWAENIEASSNDPLSMEVEMVMVGTVGGLTRIYPREAASKLTQTEMKLLRDPWEQDYYERSLFTDKYTISVPYNTGQFYMGNDTSNGMTIKASKAVRLDNDIPPAVIAAYLLEEDFTNRWIDITLDCPYEGDCERSCADEDLNCYLLDNGGFIVGTNQDMYKHHVGAFFGLIEGNIMNDMLNKTVFEKVESFDYQASCPKLEEKQTTASGRSIHVPSLSFPEALTLNWWATKASWAYVQYSLYNLLYSSWSSTTVDAQEAAEENVSCIKLEKQFYFGQLEYHYDTLVCTNNCTREWSTSKVPGTNLMLVVAEPDCDCPDMPVLQAPERVDGPNPCDLSRKPRYRKRSEHCYSFHEDENYEICGGGSRISISVTTLLINIYIGMKIVTAV
ncbi:voltage-dependent calcium channel subunit alpha-2/delta-1-like [Glandiceps talaboti]